MGPPSAIRRSAVRATGVSSPSALGRRNTAHALAKSALGGIATTHSFKAERIQQDCGGRLARESSRHSGAGHGRPEDRELSRLQISKILRREPPFDFGVAGKRTTAGAGRICQDAIEPCGEGEIACIGGDHADIAGLNLGL